jgi:CubicO group peptidase (beta-lactamase class C family)
LEGKKLRSWGEPERADLTFSVAKTYLALLAGVAHDQGLLPNLHEPIRQRVPGIGFDEGQNAAITWHQMLQQTSEWRGSYFGLSDQADHYRAVTFGAVPTGNKGDLRALQAPGTYWEYNDVRINQLSLALLYLFQRPLPDVFREFITRPVGASDNWQWVGYDNAWLDIAGQSVQSVPGGTHWGGGLSISSDDQALIGQMLLNGGAIGARQILSSAWIEGMQKPCPLAPYYGYLVWLNHDRKMFPRLPASSYFAVGAGSAFTWIEPERQMVVVVRWLDAAYAEEFFSQLIHAIDTD